MSTKFCVDCKHSRIPAVIVNPDEAKSKDYYCAHPNWSFVDVVVGQVVTSRCLEVREAVYKCGPDGVDWEPREL